MIRIKQTWIKGNVTLATFIPSEDWNDGLQFHSDDGDFVQVGTWKYNEGKQLASHVHNTVERIVSRTHEVLYVKRGKLIAHIFDLDGTFVTDIEMEAGDTLILLECGHGYTISQDDTRVLEVKNGTYVGAEFDRTRI